MLKLVLPIVQMTEPQKNGGIVLVDLGSQFSGEDTHSDIGNLGFKVRENLVNQVIQNLNKLIKIVG